MYSKSQPLGKVLAQNTMIINVHLILPVVGPIEVGLKGGVDGCRDQVEGVGVESHRRGSGPHLEEGQGGGLTESV